MISDEAFIGRRVRVNDNCRDTELQGQIGTIMKRWGDPHYVALDVLLDDGILRLFWHHELEECEGESPSTSRHLWKPQSGATFTEAEGERVT